MASKLLNLTNAQVVERARGCLRDDVKYRLEYPNGGSDPTTPKPYDKVNINGHVFDVADCIGFALWCSGISRHFIGTQTIPPFPDTPSVSGGYINCTSMIEESMGFKRRTGQPIYPGGRFFKTMFTPVPGDLIVFPGKSVVQTNPKHGHIGVISAVDAKGVHVIHCSAGNYKKFGRAVAETLDTVWKNRAARYIHLNRELLLQ